MDQARGKAALGLLDEALALDPNPESECHNVLLVLRAEWLDVPARLAMLRDARERMVRRGSAPHVLLTHLHGARAARASDSAAAAAHARLALEAAKHNDLGAGLSR